MAPVDGNCTEFTASTVQRYFRDEADLRHHCMETLPLWHSEMAERAIRSIKERLYRYFTHQGTQCWTRVIQRIVSALNASPNSSIFGMRPRDVTFANSTALRKRLAEKAAMYAIERVVRRRRQQNGEEHCLVKWKGFSTRHNSCIPASSII